MSNRGQVAIYLPQRVMKLLKIEAVKRETTLGSIMGEAGLAWIKFLKKEEMEDRKKRNELFEMEQLRREAEEIQADLDLLLKNRAEAKRKYRK
jgi:hypothetical protein